MQYEHENIGLHMARQLLHKAKGKDPDVVQCRKCFKPVYKHTAWVRIRCDGRKQYYHPKCYLSLEANRCRSHGGQTIRDRSRDIERAKTIRDQKAGTACPSLR